MISGSRSMRYHHGDRTDLLDWAGGSYRRVLEIGCGRGGNAVVLRDRGAKRIVGVEADEASAEVARAAFDVVLAEPVETALDRLDETFDLVVCGDVLEHLVDPWTTLRGLRRLTAPSGALVVSVPNIRHFKSLWRIAVGQGFKYEGEGTFDVTHLRFFTRRNLAETLEATGWRVDRVGSAAGRRLRIPRRVLSFVTGGLSEEWLTYQWFAVAQADPARTLDGGRRALRAED